jgi:glutaredoxin
MIKIYTTSWCPSCVSAKNLLAELNIDFEEINIEEENISREDLQEISGKYTVPQIIINNKCIGGYTQLLYLHQNNELNKMLNDK